MLKTLKWVYDLGVRQERVRISAHLQALGQGARVSRDIQDNIFREEMDKSRPNKKKLEQIDFDRAVQSRIEVIIQDIFQDNGQWVSGASLMYPDDKHKGEM